VKSSKPQAKAVQSNLTYFGGEIDLSIPLSMSSYKEIQKGYKKLASTSSQRTNPNFYPFFSISPKNKTLNDFHSPKVFTNVSPTQENSNQIASTLKLPPLISKVFPLLKLYLKNELKRLYSALILSKSCRDSLRTTQRTQILSTNRVMIWLPGTYPFTA